MGLTIYIFPNDVWCIIKEYLFHGIFEYLTKLRIPQLKNLISITFLNRIPFFPIDRVKYKNTLVGFFINELNKHDRNKQNIIIKRTKQIMNEMQGNMESELAMRSYADLNVRIYGFYNFYNRN
jgi:hypothetical protein